MSIATVELRAESGQIKAATQDLKNLEQQGVRTEAAANRVTNSSKQVNAAVGGMGRKAGQAGIQIQQLVGQVQGGVSPFVALSQQAADLGFVLGFPLAGAVAGIGAALIGTLIPSLFDSGDAVDELKKKILDLQDVAALTEAQRLFLIDEERAIVREKENQRAEAEEELRLIKIAIANQERLIGANERVTQARVESTKELNKQQATIDSLNAEIDDSNRKIEFYSKSQERSRKESERMLETQQKLTEQNDITATKLQEGELAALKLAAAYELGLNSAEQLPEAIALQVERAYELEQAEKAVTEAKRESEAQTRKLEQESKKAANEALRAAEAEIRKWEAAQQTARNTFAQLQDNLAVETAEDPELAKLEQQLEKRLELIDEYRLTKQADQAAADAAELAAFEALEIEKLNITKKREEEARKFTILQTSQTLSAFGNLFGNLAEIARNGGEESFGAYKALASAQAGIAAALAILQVYADQSIPTFLKLPLSITIGALAATQIAQIQNAQYGGGRALGGQVLTGTSYLVGERGPELFTPSGGGGNITPFSQLMSEARQSNQSQAGTQNLSVNFAITANDSRGFDELLVKRRDLVYNMVQKALNDQGRRL
jgi:hypothetical protein